MAGESRTDNGDWKSLYPFESHFLDQPCGRQHYVDVGPEEPSMETVLMVHGNPTWSFFYHQLIADLRPRARAIAVDHLGCGLSDRPDKFAYDYESHVENLVRLVEQLDLQNVTLVGHDWGGAIGMGCLVRMPDRFSRIVLMNTAAFPPPFFPWRIRVLRFPLLGRAAVQGLNIFARSALTMATERPGGLSKKVREGLIFPYDNWRNRRATFEFVRDIPVRKSQRTWQLLEQTESRLRGLKQRKLLIWGMKDWCFRPSCLDRFLQHWPDAETVELAGAGHYVLLDEPDLVCGSIVDFTGVKQIVPGGSS